MPIFQFPRASTEEIARLKKLIQPMPKNLSKFFATPRRDIPVETNGSKPIEARAVPDYRFKTENAKSLFDGGLRNIEITRQPLVCDNPVELLLILKPELTPHKWQFEELMRVAGYVHTGNYEEKDKVKFTKDLPLRLILAAANGSGKDSIIIAAAAIWYCLTGVRNRAIITSGSFDQIKYQTEPSVKDLVDRANKRFGRVFRSVQFHHICPELGSEIKMFATDDPGHAEGYHAWDNGGVMKIINEGKSVLPTIYQAMSRWRGVTHHLVLSSPGIGRFGNMYEMACKACHYPASYDFNSYYHRRISAYECPHITKTEIQQAIDDFGANSCLVKSSIDAEYSDYEEDTIITQYAFEECFLNPPPWVGHDIGIGLDIGGGGDEDSCWVRKGNKVIHKFHFRQKNTDLAADLINAQLESWKNSDYVFNADNGGIGQAVIDKLVTKGWRIRRRNNQSPPFTTKLYLNLGAEMWFHIKRLVERHNIILPNDEKFKRQLVTRRLNGLESTQGRLALEPKKEAIACGRPSPDRADSFVLCFFSYSPNRVDRAAEKERNKYPSNMEELLAKSKKYSIPELMALSTRGKLFVNELVNGRGKSTLLTGKL